jgi:hypothetical protein
MTYYYINIDNNIFIGLDVSTSNEEANHYIKRLLNDILDGSSPYYPGDEMKKPTIILNAY